MRSLRWPKLGAWLPLIALAALTAASAANAADPREAGPRVLIITYHTTPAHRATFRHELEESAAQWRRWKEEGVLQDYRVVYNRYVDSANWHPFAPYGYTGMSFFGHTLFGQTDRGGQPLGALAGAAVIFFAYIGFDSISTHAEEAKNPQKDVPVGIIASLVICTVLYIAVSAILTGMVPYNEINIETPVSDAFRRAGLPWARFLISLGAMTGITSVLLVMMLSQPRVWLAMARDGLFPESFFGAIHEKYRTPWKATILTGVAVALGAAFLPLRVLADLTNIGTLFAFVVVCAAVLIMRVKHPEAERPFRAPFYPVVPILGITTCMILMFSLAKENWYRLFTWLAIGFVIYFAYGRKHSVLARARARGRVAVPRPVAEPARTP